MSDTTEQSFEALAERLLMPAEPAKEPAPAPQDDVAPAPEEMADAQEVEAGDETTDAAEETDEATETETPEAPQKYTVKVDGKETEVTLDELKRSFSGNAYVQKGMQEAAEAKKQAAEIFNALQAQQAQFLQAYEAVAKQGFKAPPKAPDPSLLDADPIGYMQARARYETEAVAYQTQQQQIQQLASQQKAMQDRAFAEYVKEQAARLQERIPEFADPAKARDISAKIRAVASEAYGFSDDELGAVADARHVQVLHDAMKWRELQKAKALQKQAPQASKPVVPQGRRAEPEQLARSRQLQAARKVGKPEAFIDLLLK